MPIHLLKLIGRRDIARYTVLFTFEKPAQLNFQPGQYGGFTLLQPIGPEAGGNTRRFSLLSSPLDPHLEIAMRIQNSAYKHAFNDLSLGSEVKFAGPTGLFTLHMETTLPAVFIAGGIGITPFYSMIKTETLMQSPRELYLFYGNQTVADAAFLSDLFSFQQQNSHFHFIPTLASPDADWQGESGFITHTMIKKYIADLSLPYYYICGSPAMVTTLQETLIEMGIAEEKIKVEDFPGY